MRVGSFATVIASLLALATSAQHVEGATIDATVTSAIFDLADDVLQTNLDLSSPTSAPTLNAIKSLVGDFDAGAPVLGAAPALPGSSHAASSITNNFGQDAIAVSLDQGLEIALNSDPSGNQTPRFTQQNVANSLTAQAGDLQPAQSVPQLLTLLLVGIGLAAAGWVRWWRSERGP